MAMTIPIPSHGEPVNPDCPTTRYTVNGLLTPSAKFPIVGGLPSKYAVTRLENSNAPAPIVSTLDGIVMLVRLVAPENAYEPILVNVLGEANDTLTRPVAPANVFALIVVTPDGIVILESLVAPS